MTGGCGTTANLWSLVREIEDFQDKASERLAYDRYELLSEYAVQLRTLANVAMADDPLAYTYQSMQDAQDMLRHIRLELARGFPS